MRSHIEAGLAVGRNVADINSLRFSEGGFDVRLECFLRPLCLDELSSSSSCFYDHWAALGVNLASQTVCHWGRWVPSSGNNYSSTQWIFIDTCHVPSVLDVRALAVKERGKVTSFMDLPALWIWILLLLNTVSLIANLIGWYETCLKVFTLLSPEFVTTFPESGQFFIH